MFQIDLFSAPPLQLVGLTGALLYISNYALLTLRLIDAEDVAYFAVNLLAAALVLASLGHEFNAASLVIQLFFITVSLCGIVTRLRRTRRAGRRPASLASLGLSRAVQSRRA